MTKTNGNPLGPEQVQNYVDIAAPGIDDGTLAPGGSRAVLIVKSRERLIRQVCLRLGGGLGEKVTPVQRAKCGTDPHSRRPALAKSLCEEGKRHAEIRIDGAPGTLRIAEDLRLSRLRTSMAVPAPEQGYPLTWVKRLMKQLSDAPGELHVQTLIRGEVPGPRGALDKLRPEPAGLPPAAGSPITRFRLSLSRGLGSTRGNGESGFIRSVDRAVEMFYKGVIMNVM
ncbi:MAG: hypothetical protein WCD21_33545 [Streptomyces sp.]